jgi:uncharacterized protein (DUF427 family)
MDANGASRRSSINLAYQRGDFWRRLSDHERRFLARGFAMSESSAARSIKVPGPDHPITIERNPRRVVVRVSGQIVADSRAALDLRESSYPVVRYIPRSDVNMALLQRTENHTYCPYKGDCSYFSIAAGGERSINAVWSYESPYSAVASIKDHLAFYPTRVDSIEELD